MRILFITTIDLKKSLAERPHHLIKFIKDNGYDLTVLTITHDEDFNYESIENNVRYFRIFAKFTDLFNPYTLLRPFLKFDKRIYDLCIAEGPWGGITAVLLKKEGKFKKLVYEDIDYFPAFFDYDVVYERVRQMEKYCIANSDIIISVSNQLIELRSYQTKKNIFYIPNGVDYEAFNVERDYDGPKNTLIYSGSIEDWSGVEFIIRSFYELVKINGDMRMIILGKGSKEKMMRQLISDLNLNEKINFVGKVAYYDLPKYFGRADIGLAMLKPVEVVRYAFPLKVIEYMASGLPVISTDTGDMKEIIMSSKTGYAVPYEKNEFINAIFNIINDKARYREFSENAKNISKKYNWNCLFHKEFDIINL